MKKLGVLVLLASAGCDPAWSVRATVALPSQLPASCIEAGLKSTGGVVAPAGAGFVVDLPEGRFQVGIVAAPSPALAVDQRGIGGFAALSTVASIRKGRARILTALDASCAPLVADVRETCVRAECE